jgi:hypothetical protein
MRSHIPAMTLSLLITSTAMAALLPPLQRVAVDLGGHTESIAVSGSTLVWGEGHSIRIATLDSDGSIVPTSTLRLPRRPLSLAITGSTLFAATNALYAVDISDPEHPRMLDKISPWWGFGIGIDIGKLTALGPYLLVADRGEIGVLDVGDVHHPIATGTIVGASLSRRYAGRPDGLIVTTLDDTLRVYDISDPQTTSPTFPVIGSVAVEGQIVGVGVHDDRAIVLTDQPQAVHVVDLTDPSAPRVVGHASTIDTPLDLESPILFVSSTLAIATGSGIGVAIDISRDDAPEFAAFTLADGDSSYGQAVTGHRLVVSDRRSLAVYSVAELLNPVLVSRIDNPTWADSRLMALAPDGLVVDVTEDGVVRARQPDNDGRLEEMDRIQISSYPTHLAMDGRRVAVLDAEGTATVAQLSAGGRFEHVVHIGPGTQCTWYEGIELAGDAVWLAGYTQLDDIMEYTGCLQAVDLADPDHPQPRNRLLFSATDERVVRSVTPLGVDQLAVLVARIVHTQWGSGTDELRLVVLDTRDLDHPFVVGDLEVDIHTRFVTADGDDLLTLSWPQPSLVTIDASEPTSPTVTSMIDTRWYFTSAYRMRDTIVGHTEDPHVDDPLIVLDPSGASAAAAVLRPYADRQIRDIAVAGRFVALLGDNGRIEILEIDPQATDPDSTTRLDR